MRVVFLALGWPPAHPAGSEVMGHELCKALVRAGHDVTVSLSRPDWATSEYDLDGVHVLPFANRGQDFARARGADVIIGHLCDAGRAPAVAGRRPSIVISHNLELIPPDASLVAFNSEWLAEHHGTERPHMVVRPHVPISDYKTTPGSLVTLVNASPEKGVHTFRQVAEQMPDVGFLLVEGAHGEQMPVDLPNVTWQPLLSPDRMRDEVYARTRILLMPSAFESWGRVGIEAMSSGIPVIAHPTPGLREALANAGHFADRDDPGKWRSTIDRLLDDTAWRAASKRASSRARAVDKQTTADMAAFVAAVEQLAASR